MSSVGSVEEEVLLGQPVEDATTVEPAVIRRLRKSHAVWLLGPWVLGTILGLTLPCNSALPPNISKVSEVIGWVYFSAWSISFYPQMYTNYRRKSVVGLSLDFQVLNMLGFLCYTIYNAALFWNTSVRQQYAALHDGQLPAVHANDVFFALHAATVTGFTLLQCAYYERCGARPSRISIFAVITVVIAAVGWAVTLLVVPTLKPDSCPDSSSCPGVGLLTWLSWVYFLSYVKLGISLVKYVPQIVLNCRRESTAGFNLWNVFLDFEGGILSLSQLLLDAWTGNCWGPVIGNPVKLALGMSSMAFDVIFFVQHFFLYPHSWRKPAYEYPSVEGTRLLNDF